LTGLETAHRGVCLLKVTIQGATVPDARFGGGKFAPMKANGQKKQNVIAVG